MKITPTSSNATRKYLVLSVSATFSSLRLRNETAGHRFSVKGAQAPDSIPAIPIFGFRLAHSISPTKMQVLMDTFGSGLAR
jgi:hypothetical protein